MVQGSDWKRVVESGKQLGIRNSTRVQGLASDVLARAGRVTEKVEGLARGQVKRQLSAVGLATKDDVRNETRGSFEEFSAAITLLIDQDRRSTTELRAAVHEELQRELSALNVATKEDLAGLQATITQTSAESPRRSRAAKTPPPA